MKKTLDCKDVLENLTSFVDGDASADLREALEGHIAHCRRCRVIVDTTKRTLKIVLNAEPFEVPLAVSARLYTRLQSVLSEDLGVS